MYLRPAKFTLQAAEKGGKLAFNLGKQLVDKTLMKAFYLASGASAELLSRHAFHEETKNRIAEVLRQHEGHIEFWVQVAGGQLDYRDWNPFKAFEMEWLQVAIRTNSDRLKEIYEEFYSWSVMEITSSHITNIECNPSGRNKGSALRDVCDLFDIGMDEVIAVGDSRNDVSMIRAAGLGVAMGNGQDCAKEAADKITLSNEEDGVAAVIERHIFTNAAALTV